MDGTRSGGKENSVANDSCKKTNCMQKDQNMRTMSNMNNEKYVKKKRTIASTL